VRLLLSVLAYLNRKDDHIVRAEIMYYTCLLLCKEVKYEAIDFKTPSDEYEQILEDITGVQLKSDELQTGRLSDLIQQLIRIFGFNDDDPFIQFFADEILLYASRYGNGIGDFLIWWDGVKHKKSIIYPESIDAVRIMTIHKSKGLQFPVVILADAAEKKKLTKNFFWVPIDKKWLPQLHVGILPVEKTVKETEFAPLYEREDAQSFLDMLNLLYVGTTRPEDALYILSDELEKEPTENNSVTALLITYLRKLERWDNSYNTVTFGDSGYSKLPSNKKVVSDHVYIKQKTDTKGLLASSIKTRMRANLLWSEETKGYIDKGNLLHEALKRIKYEGDERQVVRNMRAEGWVEENDESRLLAEIKQVVYHPDMNVYFKPGLTVVNERAVLKRNEKMHFPDRVVLTTGGATVIDYKTGNPRPEHAQQLNTYAKLLAEAGIDVAAKIIFYTVAQKAEVVQ
jgi:ATP-dependent exoDNAse (exonuclease V) beta subunit